METYLTCREVADLYKVKLTTVWGWIRAGKLPAIAVSKKTYRIKAGDLERFEKTARKKTEENN